MRTITKTIKVYKFAELSEDAKQHAKDRWANSVRFDRGDEYLDSLKALAKYFDGKLSNWEIDWFGGGWSVDFQMPIDMEPKEIKRRLDALGSYDKKTFKGDGDCKLTGMCYDEAAIDGFRQAWFLDGERDLAVLMHRAAETWHATGRADCDYDYSDEGFGERSEANEYEYDEEGGIV